MKYFFCAPSIPLILYSQTLLETSGEKKSKSYKVVIVFILLMFVIQTIRTGCDWYRG
jgi:hypothetical protein